MKSRRCYFSPAIEFYAETSQIWFESIDCIYLSQEMRSWVRGGAAGFQQNRNLAPLLFFSEKNKKLFISQFYGFILHADLYFVCLCRSSMDLIRMKPYYKSKVSRIKFWPFSTLGRVRFCSFLLILLYDVIGRPNTFMQKHQQASGK